MMHAVVFLLLCALPWSRLDVRVVDARPWEYFPAGWYTENCHDAWWPEGDYQKRGRFWYRKREGLTLGLDYDPACKP